MNLQILTYKHDFKNIIFSVYDESNKQCLLKLIDEKIESMYVPNKTTEKSMIKNNQYYKYATDLKKYGNVVYMRSSRYECLGKVIPVLYTSIYIDKSVLKRIGYVKYSIGSQQRFLQRIGSSPSGTCTFKETLENGDNDGWYRCQLKNIYDGIDKSGYVKFHKHGEYKHIDPVVTMYDFETHSPFKKTFKKIGQVGGKVYTVTLGADKKCKFIVSLNVERNVKVWKSDNEIETCEYPDDIIKFIKDSIENDLYCVTINIEWNETNLFWILMGTIIKYLKTNILSGWNIDGFDNIHLLYSCPQEILEDYFMIRKWRSNKILIEKSNDFIGSIPLQSDMFIANDMMKAYKAIKNPSDGSSLKKAGKGLTVEKIDLPYEEIGRITRYNHFEWIRRNCKSIKDIKNELPFLTSSFNSLFSSDSSNDSSNDSLDYPSNDSSNDSSKDSLDDSLDGTSSETQKSEIEKAIDIVRKIMLIDGDQEENTYIERYDHVQKYALYDILVPIHVMKNIDFVKWLFVNSDQSFIWLNEKMNRGISHILFTYLNQVCYERGMYMSHAVEKTFRPTGGYTAPVTKFSLKNGVICDLDANSMYPTMMKGYNISCGTIFDDKDLVYSMTKQGVKFRKDKLDFTSSMEKPYQLELDKKVSLKCIEEAQPKRLQDKFEKSIFRDFKHIQDFQVCGFTIQLYPFCLIGGNLNRIKYHDRGDFYSGDLTQIPDVTLNCVEDIIEYMKENYQKYKKTYKRPTHIQITTKKFIFKGRQLKSTDKLLIYRNDDIMVEIQLTSKNVGETIDLFLKCVYDRDVWYTETNEVAIMPYSQDFLAKTRKNFKNKMKPLKKRREDFMHGKCDDLSDAEKELLKDLDQKQAATKVLMNAEYGYLNTLGAKSNNPTASAAITTMGRRSIVDVYNALVMFGGYITSGDTDSAMACYPFIDIDLLEKNQDHSKEHWSNSLKRGLVDLGNMHLRTTKNVMTLGADGVFMIFLTLAKKNYLRMDVCSLEYEPIGLPFIKGGFSEVYCDVGLDILKMYSDRKNTKSINEIKDIVYKKFDDHFSDEMFDKYKECEFNPSKAPPIVEIKRTFRSTQIKNAIKNSRKNGFDPMVSGEVWFVTDGNIGIDFRALSKFKNNKKFFNDIKLSLISKLDSYINSKNVLV